MSSPKKIVSTALLIAAGVALPLAFHALPNAGRVFLPMHIPVLLCGLLCGFPWGLACGVITPLLSTLLTGMPPAAMLPAMLCELAAYGLVSALLARHSPVKNPYARVYLALAGAMLSGRLVQGALNALVFSAGSYSLRLWLTGAFVTALPGIAIQAVLIPAIVFGLQKAKLMDMKHW
ncbi:MAG: ECF transporter S component [Oscillospiraceae bacterium]|nr:ECF transporter S component [Oscillospiraceae bacterium]